MSDPAQDAEKHEAPPPAPASTPWRALGEVAAILAVTPAYKFYSLADLEWLVMPPLQAQQCRICHKGPRPIGVVLWAMLDEETASHMLDPRFRLRPDQWTCGDQVWVTDLVHTGGSDPALSNAMLQDVRTVIGPDVPIHIRPLEMLAKLRAGAEPAG
jgi:hemolysin-activating ACP:hemolysin acyltransferase